MWCNSDWPLEHELDPTVPAAPAAAIIAGSTAQTTTRRSPTSPAGQAADYQYPWAEGRRQANDTKYLLAEAALADWRKTLYCDTRSRQVSADLPTLRQVHLPASRTPARRRRRPASSRATRPAVLPTASTRASCNVPSAGTKYGAPGCTAARTLHQGAECLPCACQPRHHRRDRQERPLHSPEPRRPDPAAAMPRATAPAQAARCPLARLFAGPGTCSGRARAGARPAVPNLGAAATTKLARSGHQDQHRHHDAGRCQRPGRGVPSQQLGVPRTARWRRSTIRSGKYTTRRRRPTADRFPRRRASRATTGRPASNGARRGSPWGPTTSGAASGSGRHLPGRPRRDASLSALLQVRRARRPMPSTWTTTSIPRSSASTWSPPTRPFVAYVTCAPASR